MVDNQTLDRIKSYFDIVDFVGRYVQLKKRGANYLGLCPFHNEKTPSFTVSPAKQIWHCFGCGEGGNIFSFLMNVENINFIEAVKKLGEEAGIEIEDDYRDPKKVSQEKRLFTVNQKAAEYYRQQLTDQQMQYLKKRGLSTETIADFEIGYAPDKWDGLKLQLSKEKQQDLLSLGLLIKSDQGKLYDRFRNRIMFPIKDLSDRVIGFGGRALDAQDKAKYLNSPDSPLFNKGYNLFALNLAKRQVSKQGYLMLMEGYMDVIAAHQNGFATAVASLGTALTIEQARLLKRYSKKIIIAYDNDAAGIKAAERAIEVMMPLDLDIRILQIPPESKDPDDYLLTNGPEKFGQLIENAAPFIRFKLDRILNSYKITLPEEKEQAIRDCVAFLKDQPAVIREEYAGYLAQKLKLNRETVLSYLVTTNKYKLPEKSRYVSRPKNKFDEAERILLLAALRDIEVRKLLKELPSELISETRRIYFSRLADSQLEEQVLLAELADNRQKNDKELLSLLTEISMLREKIDDNETKAAFDTIYSRKVALTYDELRAKLHQAQESGDEEAELETLQMIKKLKEELYAQN